MMYYCPCPCGEPVDTEQEENTFLALPRKLSYVQDSYLDAHSVSGRFVFNPHTERRIAANTFNPELNAAIWSADGTKVEATADVDYEGEYVNGDGGEDVSLLSVVKSQEFPINLAACDFREPSSASNLEPSYTGTDQITPSTSVVQPRSSGAFVVRSPPSSAACVIKSPLPSSSTGTSNFNASSFISKVTSLISPKDETGCDSKSNIDLGSSVDAESCYNQSDPKPSQAVLRSPDRSGLTMDRGEDLIVSAHGSHVILTCDGAKTITMDESTYPRGPELFCDDEEELVSSRLGSVGTTERTDDSLSDPVGHQDTADVSKKSQPNSSSDVLRLSCVNNSDIPKLLAPKNSSCESPDSDAFSEEGVFVNMMDDTENGIERTASEVSDDTNVSVDSMLWSPEEVEEAVAEQEDLPRKMSLEEAISRAASDFNKMTMMMYPDLKYDDDDNLPGTSKDCMRSERHRGSSLREMYGLSIDLPDQADGQTSEPRQEHICKESPLYEDHEFNFNKQNLRKSSSLKTNKTPPGTPHRKKVVRFADAMGLDLESVRHVLNMESPPKIPASAMADLKQGLSDDRLDVGSRYLAPCFTQPGASENFFHTVVNKKVRLENAIITDLTITGFIRVANVAFHKSVRVRYTHNRWATFHDIAASYIPNSCDGPTDRFSFSIVAPAFFVPGDRLEFAVSYSAGGTEFWDNNEGDNYVFECFAKTIPNENESGWIHFL